MNIPPGKFYTPEAKKLIVKLKDYGMSYWWIEMRMGTSSNWGRRIVNDKALVNDAQLAYLRELVRIISMLPKKMRRVRLHPGTSSPRYVDPLKPKSAPKPTERATGPKLYNRAPKTLQ